MKTALPNMILGAAMMFASIVAVNAYQSDPNRECWKKIHVNENEMEYLFFAPRTSWGWRTGELKVVNLTKDRLECDLLRQCVEEKKGSK